MPAPCLEESYPTSSGWDEHGWARGRADTQTHQTAPLSRACFLPLLELGALAVLLQGCRALVRDMGRLPLPAFEFQVEILLFEWKKKVLQTVVHLPALSLWFTGWALDPCDSVPVVQPLSLCICSCACSFSSQLPAVLLLGPPSSPGEAFSSKGAVQSKGRSGEKLRF